MKKIVLTFLIVCLALMCVAVPQSGNSQALRPPEVKPAIDGIMFAFQSHPLVGMGDYHGLAQEEDFYAAIIRDPRFARDVGNVVVEFGEASSQPIIDRFVNGEEVPYGELRKVWSNTVGWVPTVTAQGLINVFAAMRDSNLILPPDQRIHVWLGDPPMDWSKLKTLADARPVLDQRDSYPAGIIEREILEKGKKALVIYGTFHYYGDNSLWGLVSKAHPGAFFRVTPYTGFVENSCSEAVERLFRAWPVPALVMPVRGTTLEAQIHRVDCHYIAPGSVGFGPAVSREDAAKRMAPLEEQSSGVAGEALLYLGPASSLTLSALSPDIYLDAEYRAEIDRHNGIRGLPSLKLGVASNPATPRRLRP